MLAVERRDFLNTVQTFYLTREDSRKRLLPMPVRGNQVFGVVFANGSEFLCFLGIVEVGGHRDGLSFSIRRHLPVESDMVRSVILHTEMYTNEFCLVLACVHRANSHRFGGAVVGWLPDKRKVLGSSPCWIENILVFIFYFVMYALENLFCNLRSWSVLVRKGLAFVLVTVHSSVLARFSCFTYCLKCL